MSRIDEALKRAKGTPAGPGPVRQADVFVSAWDTPADNALRAEHAARTENTLRLEKPEAPGVKPAPILSRAEGKSLPTFSSKWKERLASSSQCDPLLLEQFRKLAATLHNAQTANGLRTILVTSSNPNEGKTMTAINLAIVLSESYGRRVLLIDADLRRPSIGEVVDVTGSVGLSAALRATADQKLAVIPITSTLTLLPAGPPDPDPLGGLTSSRMRRIVEEAAGRFDWVILDGPPTGLLADANLLAQMVDGALFVIRAGKTPHASAEKALASLGRDRVLGVVLNGTEKDSTDEYGPYYRSDPRTD